VVSVKGGDGRCLATIMTWFQVTYEGLVVRLSESASRPLVNFGVLNDNLIKCLISCAKCISKF
jgi:hypothetical protein